MEVGNVTAFRLVAEGFRTSTPRISRCRFDCILLKLSNTKEIDMSDSIPKDSEEG